MSKRDSDYDGVFVFAVRTTGIYCRPSCPSVRPKRENVSFYGLPELAESAGYRPCKRCHPRDAQARDPQVDLVRQICAYIDASEVPPTLEQIAQATHFSRYYVQRVFTKVMGISPHDYAEAQRIQRVKGLLREGHSVTQALYEAGYSSSSRLYEKALNHLGMTPAVYGRGGSGMKMVYTVQDCSLGRALIAMTERGLCAVYLGDDDASLIANLHAEYPAANICAGDGGVQAWVEGALNTLEGAAPPAQLPTDVIATAFQRRVWDVLQTIPAGETYSYRQVAERLNAPNAVRAVAQACAHNRLAVIIPCHRVVRTDGDLAGYRWGKARKAALLAREKRFSG